MACACSPKLVATVAAFLSFALSAFAAFGVYTVATPGWAYFVPFSAGAAVALAILSALLTYTISVLLQS